MNLALSKSAGYAIHAMTYIAKHDSGAPIMAREISSAYNLPYDSILKILRVLAKEGHLRPHRGCHGGFALMIPAEKITLLEIVEAIDGPVGKVDGALHDVGDREVGNRADELFGAAANELKRSLASHSIADLVGAKVKEESNNQGGREGFDPDHKNGTSA